MKVLLVYPSTPETFWSFKHVLPLVPKRAAFPPLGMLTVAGLLPKDWEIRLVDLNVEPLGDHDLRWADYVMLSAMIVHRAAVTGLMERCRRSSSWMITLSAIKCRPNPCCGKSSNGGLAPGPRWAS